MFPQPRRDQRPRASTTCILAFLMSVACLWSTASHAGIGFSTGSACITFGHEPDGAELRIAEVLERRLERRSKAQVRVEAGAAPGPGLQIILGKTDQGGAMDRLCEVHGIELPTYRTVAPESYAAKFVTLDGGPAVVAVGADTRGLLYAVGEILRQVRFSPDDISIGPIDVSTAPAYRFRGSSASQGGTMLEVTGARAWSAEQWQEYALDLALSGANCFYASGASFDFVKGFDLMAITHCRPNELPGLPKEWQGTEYGHWACPSIPEAREALMKRWAGVFAERQDFDILRMYAGDPGGCRCERCAPWGKTFVRLCEEVAALWLQSHPGSIVMIANQDLDNAGDQAIFDYLNAEPRTWLYAIAYGPGSNATSRYFRREQREDLFVYPGAGPLNRYLAEILNQIPKDQRIVHYSDITHWISAQYMVEDPEPYLVALYGRRTFHARPKAFYRIFQAIMPFSEGDIIYSEGYHDEFHQYLWNRLLWDPNRTPDDVTMEYCRLHFGDEAAPLMKEALFQLEENLEAPIADNDGIDRYYGLVRDAGAKMPAHLMARNHRWRLHMQKAALDMHLRLKVREVRRRTEEVKRVAAEALQTRESDSALQEAEALLAAPLENDEMKALREEAGRLGEESNALFGVRNVGYFVLDRAFRDIHRLSRMVKAALAASALDERRELLQEIVEYERPARMSPIMAR